MHRSIGYSAAILCLALGCDGPRYTDAPFGYDARPSNTTCKPPPRPASGAGTGVKLEQVFTALSFSSPVGLILAPGEPDRYYVIEQTGKVRAFRAGDASTVEVLSYGNADLTSGGETGLLGLAFAPDWTTSRTAYVSRTAPGGSTGLRSVLTRIRSSDGGNTLDRATEQEILVVEQPFSNHNGGNIVFGPDGYLYFGLGDGGSGGDPMGNGQKLSTLLGKMLRIDVAGGGAYKVPDDNPFVGTAGAKPEIWAYGLRNPWRWSFDRATGDLWVGDVGQNAWEEIDRVERGGNYGWNTREGKHCYGASTCSTAGFVEPIVEYSHSEGQSVTGGYVYRGSAIPALLGSYVYGDYVSSKMWALFPDGNGVLAAVDLLDAPFNISSFGEGADGEMYVLDYSGKIWKLVSDGQPGMIGFPQKLSRTGCFDAEDARKIAPGLIPYSVNVPFWSDGADKERFLALPDGKQIGVGADGDLALPIGTVLVKHFALGDRRIETRLFMHHDDDSWAGYTYEWDDSGTDATLVVGGKKKTLDDTHAWLYPSGAQCLSCHSTAAGNTLGMEVRQLDRENEYPDTARRSPQLDTLAHIGLFDAPLPALEPMPLPYGADATAPLETRARAWLHTNCSFCHRPGGSGGGSHDLRFDRTFKETGLCGTAPTAGDLGVPGAQLLTPGAPTQSILSLRLHATDDKRMPPLASLLHDEEGTALVDAWIRSITVCPP